MINRSAESPVHPELVNWLEPLLVVLYQNPILLEVTRGIEDEALPKKISIAGLACGQGYLLGRPVRMSQSAESEKGNLALI